MTNTEFPCSFCDATSDSPSAATVILNPKPAVDLLDHHDAEESLRLVNARLNQRISEYAIELRSLRKQVLEAAADEDRRLGFELHDNGLDLISDLHKHYPRIRILVVSAFDESLYAERVLRAGAHGYISKRDLQDSFVDALRKVLAGERSLSHKMTQRLLGQAIGRFDPAEADSLQNLSNRELEVFQMIGRGITTGAIAKQLLLSVHTIDSHREKIRHKLGIANGTELMQRSVQWVLENR